MAKKEMKIICFDIDGVVVDGISWYLLTEGLGCSRLEHDTYFEKAKQGVITFREAEVLFTLMYQQSGQATRENITQLFQRIPLREEVGPVISYLRQKGYSIYLISGSIDLYVSSIASKIKVDGYYANSSLDFDAQGELKAIHYRDNQGEVKVEQLNDLSQKLNCKISSIYFIGDSENDIPAFKATGKGIAVYTQNENVKKAAYKVLSSLSEIPQVVS